MRFSSATRNLPLVKKTKLSRRNQLLRRSEVISKIDRRQYKALLTLLLLGPGTPMLFQGQEFASSAPFGYFADHQAPLADLVCTGRLDSLRKFRSINNDSMLQSIERPDSSQLFQSCKLDYTERAKNAEMYALTRELLSIRAGSSIYREDSVQIQGAVIDPEALCVRLDGSCSVLLLMINLGPDLELSPCAQPLLAPPPLKQWTRLLSSEDPIYGGFGCGEIFTEADIYLPAKSSVFFRAGRHS